MTKLIPQKLNEQVNRLFDGPCGDLVLNCDAGKALKARVIDSRVIDTRAELDEYFSELADRGLKGNVTLRRCKDSESVRVEVEEFLDLPKHYARVVGS